MVHPSQIECVKLQNNALLFRILAMGAIRQQAVCIVSFGVDNL